VPTDDVKRLRKIEAQLRESNQSLASCRQQEESLRRIGRRLAVAAQGRDDSLDAVLERASETLRKSTSETELDRLAQELSKAVLVLDDFTAKARAICAQRFLAAVDWPAALSESAHAVDPHEPDDPIKAVASLVNDALRTPQQAAAPASPGGLLQRLFGRSSAAPVEPQTEPDPGEAETSAACEVEAAETDCRAQVHEALQQLVERLPLTADLDPEVEDIKAKLNTPDAEITSLAIRRLADLFARMRSSARQEVAEYRGLLGDVSDKLAVLDQILSEDFASREAQGDNGRNMGALLDNQIGDMRTHIAEVEDPARLRHLLNERLETLSSHFHDYRQEEERRLNEALERATEMRQRVNELESEAHQLRENMEKERDRAMTDGLTGLPNRFQIEERIEAEFERFKRFQQPLSVVVWDVDYFKRINDKFGHKAGDKVLQIVARKLAERARATDFVGRYGGEEFLMLLIGTAGQEALGVAEEIRKTIADCRFHYRELPVLVSISGGVAEFQPGDEPDVVFERADAAMYQAKQAGRNCCVLAPA